MSSDVLSLNTLAGLLYLLIIAGVWYRVYRSSLSFRWRLRCASLPVVGSNARHQRNPALRTPLRGDLQISTPEIALVASVLPSVRQGLSKAAFGNTVSYVKKAEDTGVHVNAPPLLLTIALVIAVPEGYSASFVIAPWISAEVSESSRELWAGLGGYGLSTMLVVLAHWAGSLSRRARFARRHFDAYQEDGRRGNFTPPEIAPGDDQSIDDHAPAYEQFRARSQTSFWAAGSRVIFASIMAFGLLLVALRGIGLAEEGRRQETFAAQLQQQTEGSTESTTRKVASSTGDGIGQAIGSAVALGLFLMTFLATQTIGFLAGAAHGLNGSRSAEAYHVLGGHTSYESYQLCRENAIAALEPVYADLQGGLMIRGRTHTPTLRETISWLENQHQHAHDGHPPADSSRPSAPHLGITALDPAHRFGRSGVSAMRGDQS